LDEKIVYLVTEQILRQN